MRKVLTIKFQDGKRRIVSVKPCDCTLGCCEAKAPFEVFEADLTDQQIGDASQNKITLNDSGAIVAVPQADWIVPDPAIVAAMIAAKQRDDLASAITAGTAPAPEK